MRFSLSGEAEEDIIAIAEQGVRLFGSGQAKRYHDELFAILDVIATNPRIARERDEIYPPVRIHPFKAQVVYRIEDNEAIFVIRVRHGNEDWVNNTV
ncbi:type II toxin-antitoxin system RelE/ParE family toxin [Rhizobium sp. PL01]|uniref:type II toxin-antitoxin system RelE/ParE family toxin n=1 Tax=Rhizobium sp. PL01 TaxID=3085631 RepID=UPI002981F187|nr:type II toxin-antitoxin system RelE/ParE family toxin [Rhizobium sp. PL01]MDW5317057.1 type II toxin-antitoxin system RelE/ParE family toxin [Rhizobium sp. PL01]